jgi:hypothetical protein
MWAKSGSFPDKDLLVFVRGRERGLAMIENIKLSPIDLVV